MASPLAERIFVRMSLLASHSSVVPFVHRSRWRSRRRCPSSVNRRSSAWSEKQPVPEARAARRYDRTVPRPPYEPPYSHSAFFIPSSLITHYSSLFPQRYRWIESRRAPGRQVAGEECDADQEQRDRDECQRVGRAHVEDQALHQSSPPQTSNQTQRYAQ